MKQLTLLLIFLVFLIQPGLTNPASIQTIQPEKAQADQSLRLPARTAPSLEAEIYSRATGVVGERRVDIGDRVQAGDILAIIEAPELQRDLERAQAAAQQARARAELAVTALQRAQVMSKNRVIAEEALDEREAAAKTSQADLLAAQAEMNRIAQLIDFQTIRAPFASTVAERSIDKGDHIEGDRSAQNGRSLFRLVCLSELRVEIDAPPAAALRLRPGQKATLEFPELPGRTFAAEVRRSSGVIDPASGTMRVELILDNSDFTLPAGLNGIATINVGENTAALRVPTNTILVRDGKSHVAKVENGKIAFAPVKTGRNFGPKIEILNGIQESDTLVVSPNSLLREGDSVVTQ